MSQDLLRKLVLCVLLSTVISFSQTRTSSDAAHDALPGMPSWTDLVRVSATQEGQSIILELETADTIPHMIRDSCSLRFFLQSHPHSRAAADHIVEFNLRGWDGARWFATFMLHVSDTAGAVSARSRIFDWDLQGAKFRVRFSLISLPWEHIRFGAGIYLGDSYADMVPDSGMGELVIDRRAIPDLTQKREGRVRLLYPTSFDSVITRYSIPEVLEMAYCAEKELTGVVPVGGDSVRFEFDPYIGGAALEGDPIAVGPYMWGKTPLWFVYFHEMGHNFCNASVRFRRMYPLQFSSSPGPLPANLLFYEAFATLPAMYVFDEIALNRGNRYQLRPDVRESIQKEWQVSRNRFEGAWQEYKAKPSFSRLTPDIIDGLILELQATYGWEMMKRLYRCLQPQDSALALLDNDLPGDTPDLRCTRSTYAAALISAAASTDLMNQFVAWGFPVDQELFSRAYHVFSTSLVSSGSGTTPRSAN